MPDLPWDSMRKIFRDALRGFRLAPADGSATATVPPLIQIRIDPIGPDDRIGLGRALAQLRLEDSTLSAEVDEATGAVTLGGVGEVQLEIVLDRLKREFDVTARVGRPHIAYLATVTRAAYGEGRYMQRLGDRRHYGHVRVRIDPAHPRSGVTFVNELAGEAIPSQFIEPIRLALVDALAHGPLSGYPVQDVIVTLCDGSYHDTDSSALAFERAAASACHDAVRKAGPVLIEPVVLVEVSVPDQHAASVVTNLLSRGARRISNDDLGGRHLVRTRVPLSGMFGYSTDLRERTWGRATVSIAFDSYQMVRHDPGDDIDDIAPVGAPLRPVPGRRSSAIALPEPDDDDVDETPAGVPWRV